MLWFLEAFFILQDDDFNWLGCLFLNQRKVMWDNLAQSYTSSRDWQPMIFLFQKYLAAKSN